MITEVSFLIRHYRQTKLKNTDPNQRFNYPSVASVWQLSPYEVSRFSGELLQVMANAAQLYIYEKSLSEIKKEFQRKLIQNQNPS
jgi:hypothetical protein